MAPRLKPAAWASCANEVLDTPLLTKTFSAVSKIRFLVSCASSFVRLAISLPRLICQWTALLSRCNPKNALHFTYIRVCKSPARLVVSSQLSFIRFAPETLQNFGPNISQELQLTASLSFATRGLLVVLVMGMLAA